MTVTKELPETGASLALRALGWGTLYAFTGCGILFYSIWKLSGAKNVCLIRFCILRVKYSISRWKNSVIK